MAKICILVISRISKIYEKQRLPKVFHGKMLQKYLLRNLFKGFRGIFRGIPFKDRIETSQDIDLVRGQI